MFILILSELQIWPMQYQAWNILRQVHRETQDSAKLEKNMENKAPEKAHVYSSRAFFIFPRYYWSDWMFKIYAGNSPGPVADLIGFVRRPGTMFWRLCVDCNRHK